MTVKAIVHAAGASLDRVIPVEKGRQLAPTTSVPLRVHATHQKKEVGSGVRPPTLFLLLGFPRFLLGLWLCLRL